VKDSSAKSRATLMQRGLDRFARNLLSPNDMPPFDFTRPSGEEALVPSDSVSWRVFKNPLSLFVGGVAAVIMEFSEPRVRAGVWQFSNFRTNPLARLQRTGLAAMMTVYGPRSATLAMIRRISKMHDRVEGKSPEGLAYRANDPDLLRFVHATAVLGFSESYNRYVHPLRIGERNQICAEGVPSARAYGVIDAPATLAELEECLREMESNLSPSPILEEFLTIMGEVPLLPGPLKPFQRLLVRTAIDIVPPDYRTKTGLGPGSGLRRWETRLVRRLGALADKLPLLSLPPAQSCLRLSLPADYLYRRPVESGTQSADMLIAK
jgi:uncharacterized protein (DUF2236 family)